MKRWRVYGEVARGWVKDDGQIDVQMNGDG